MFSSCIILLGLLGSLKRPDFPNLVLGIITLLCCHIGINKGLKKGIKWFKNALLYDLILLLYDIIWLCTHYEFMFNNKFTGGKENTIGIISVICCALNILIKAATAVLLHKQYSDTKNLEQDNINKIDSNF